MNEVCSQKRILPQILPAICLSAAFQLGACAQATDSSGNTAKTEANQVTEPAPPAAPKVQPAQPQVDVTVRPHEQKLMAVKFAEPDKDNKHAPRTFKATAYSIHGRTRSGARTRPGVLAADPRLLPLGTVVDVKAGKYSGVYTVHDTGGAIKGNRVDVWLPTTREAVRFGRRNVKLVVLRYPGQNAPKQEQKQAPK